MTQRRIALLLGLVSEYIRTGQPLGSTALARRLKMDVSPATVRAELHSLEDEGYVVQPHTSAGRVPTDQGYRFFVDQACQTAMAINKQDELSRQFSTLFLAQQQLLKATSRFLANLTHTAAVSSQSEPADVQEAGLRELVQHSDSHMIDELHELSALLEQLDERLVNQTIPKADSTAVYIGQEIPFMHAQHNSMLVRSATTTDGREMTLILVGPKRMSYQRNLSLLNTMANIIERESL